MKEVSIDYNFFNNFFKIVKFKWYIRIELFFNLLLCTLHSDFAWKIVSRYLSEISIKWNVQYFHGV